MSDSVSGSDPPGLPGGNGRNAGSRRQLMLTGSVGVHHVDGTVVRAERLERMEVGNLRPVWRPGRSEVVAVGARLRIARSATGQLVLVRPVGVHDPDLAIAERAALERDLRAVGAPVGDLV